MQFRLGGARLADFAGSGLVRDTDEVAIIPGTLNPTSVHSPGCSTPSRLSALSSTSNVRELILMVDGIR